LQTTIFRELTFIGVAPQICLVLVVVAGMLSGKEWGAICGAGMGLLYDIVSGRIVGLNAILFMYIGFFVGVLCKGFFKHKRIVVLFFTAAAELTYSILYYFFAFFIWGQMNIIYVFSKIIVPELLYTTVVAVPIYVLMEKINDYIERKTF
jgi:rod shape-determining protein MreD